MDGDNANSAKEFGSCLSRPSGLVSRVLAANEACKTGR